MCVRGRTVNVWSCVLVCVLVSCQVGLHDLQFDMCLCVCVRVQVRWCLGGLRQIAIRGPVRFDLLFPSLLSACSIPRPTFRAGEECSCSANV